MASPRHTVGTYLARRLIEVGIGHFFAVPGDYVLNLLDELISLEPELKLVSCCNELDAAYATDGYARVRGAACALVTFTVGGLSAVNGEAGAYSDDLPLILVSGAPNSNDFASDRVLHHTIGEMDRRQALEVYQHVVADAGQSLTSILLVDRSKAGASQDLQCAFDLLILCMTHATVEIRSPAQAARQIDHAIVTALTQRKPVYI